MASENKSGKLKRTVKKPRGWNVLAILAVLCALSTGALFAGYAVQAHFDNFFGAWLAPQQSPDYVPPGAVNAPPPTPPQNLNN
jgi:hypothetical protein